MPPGYVLLSGVTCQSKNMFYCVEAKQRLRQRVNVCLAPYPLENSQLKTLAC